MNKIILMGRLVKDPEVSATQSGTTVGRFSIAVDRRFKKEGDPDADFFNVTTFSKLAEFVERYLKKGTKISLVGRLQNDNYTDKNGNKVYSVKVIAEEIEFAESKNSGSGSSEQKSGDSFLNVPEGLIEELPFN